MNILFVTPESPFFSTKGYSKLLLSRAASFAHQHHRVSLIYQRITLFQSTCILENPPIEPFSEIFICRTNLFSVLFSFVLHLFFYRKKPLQSSLSHAAYRSLKQHSITFANHYQIAHFYLLRTQYFWSLFPDSTRLVDLVDSLSLNLTRRINSLSTTKLLQKLLLSNELSRILDTESSITANYSPKAILLVSPVDAIYLQRVSKTLQTILVSPISIQVPPYRKSPSPRYPDLHSQNPLKLIFFGTLTYQPNIDAVNFLLAYFSELSSLDPFLSSLITITIAGKGASCRLKSQCSHQRISLVSPVDDMSSLVRSHHASLLPLFSGSGIQYKVIESMAWSVPVITTNIAARPIGLKHLQHALLFDTKQELTNLLLQLLASSHNIDSLTSHSHSLVQAYSDSSVNSSLLQNYQRLSEAS